MSVAAAIAAWWVLGGLVNCLVMYLRWRESDDIEVTLECLIGCFVMGIMWPISIMVFLVDASGKVVILPPRKKRVDRDER